jgi:kojibiose phosphorylase
MKDFFTTYLSEEPWRITENGWDPGLQNTYETLFTLGNGYAGSRGVLEEIPYDAYAGTYIAGVYDTSVAQVSEMVNLPNPLDFRLVAEGEKVGMGAMDVIEHRRALDMRKGLLWRHTVFSNSRKERLDYQSIRFFSMDNPHVSVMKVCFTPLDKPIEILARNEVNTAVTNKGILTEGRKNHIRIAKVARLKNVNFICVGTVESKVSVAYADQLYVSYGNDTYSTPHRAFRLTIDKGKTVCFTCFHSIVTTRDITLNKLKSTTVRTLRKAVRKDFDGLLNEHASAWEKQWRQADISIKPASDLQQALRFNIYHLLISASEHTRDASIGARTLSGEGYRGHIFWDTELYIVPFFIYTNPRVARTLLMYRYHRLDAARHLAAENGYKGALFPWESARRGIDVTPEWHKDLDGRIIKIYTGQREHHIVSDIAYAVYHYFLATGDGDFMVPAGLEMMFEAARFWASRVTYDKKQKMYHITNVIGPDEFHEDVDDNAFTNAMARYTLLKAVDLYNHYREHQSKAFKKLIKRIKLSEKETDQWHTVADAIYLPVDTKKGILESFHGYLNKKDVRITNLDTKLMPMFPEGVSVRDAGKTQLLKQADVVMLLYLLSDHFTAKEKKDNFLYYEKRTMHKSSLSACAHALLASDVKEYEKAHRYFTYAVNGDLKGLFGNIVDGMHAASIGGTWQAVVNGFCGMRMVHGMLSFDPHLPPFLKEISFSVHYKTFELSVTVRRKKMEIVARSHRGAETVRLLMYGTARKLRSNKKYTFTKRRA